MNAKKLKDWVNSLPDDAIIQVLSSPHMSFPMKKPVLHAINSKTIKSVSEGIVSGKVISSLFVTPMSSDDPPVDLHNEINPERF
jgi:hypothetical protein